MFEFATATRIIFGCDTVQEIGRLSAGLGTKPLLVGNGPGIELVAKILAEMYEIEIVQINDEPTVDKIIELVAIAKRRSVDFVVAVGGGSAIDAGKAIAAMLANPGELLDYLEVVGLAKPLQFTSVPIIAIPTTAGTGSEVTRNAVVGVPEKGVKVSLRSSFLYPRLALIDPTLTLSLPQAITASTGMDALTQVIEPFVSIKANRMTDIFCKEGIEKISASIRRAYHHGNLIAARENMSWGSLLGGLALANSGLGAVHGFAAAIGGAFAIPHGTICACLLPIVTQMNLRSCLKHEKQDALDRYTQIARMIFRSGTAEPRDLVRWLFDLKLELEINSLGAYGITKNHIPQIVESAMASSSMKGNPVSLTMTELEEIVAEAI